RPRLQAGRERWHRRYLGGRNATRRLVLLPEHHPEVHLRQIAGVGLRRGGRAARGLLKGLLPAVALVWWVEGMQCLPLSQAGIEVGLPTRTLDRTAPFA